MESSQSQQVAINALATKSNFRRQLDDLIFGSVSLFLVYVLR